MARAKKYTHVVTTTCCERTYLAVSEAEAKKLAARAFAYMDAEGDEGEVLISKVVMKATRGELTFTKT